MTALDDDYERHAGCDAEAASSALTSEAPRLDGSAVARRQPTGPRPRSLDELLDLPLFAPGTLDAFKAFVRGIEQRADAAERRVGILVDRLGEARAPVPAGPMPTAWVSVEEAAPFLDITPDALRKRLRRAARKEGGVAKLAGGIEGRQIGESWRVHFPAGWRRS